uniref:Uncharacterized protein n=1 Tax=Arundo donax TaxID=35708 RepID=A0A0A9C196_ARUDO
MRQVGGGGARQGGLLLVARARSRGGAAAEEGQVEVGVARHDGQGLPRLPAAVRGQVQRPQQALQARRRPPRPRPGLPGRREPRAPRRHRWAHAQGQGRGAQAAELQAPLLP